MKWFVLVSLLNIPMHDNTHHVSVLRKVMESHGAPTHRAQAVSREIVAQSRLWQVDPALITAIVVVENHTLVSDTSSTAGAIGVMQVMPFWRRSFGSTCGHDLANDAVNICFGIHVLKTFLRERGTEERALLAYNGCKTLERCGHYPRRVLRHRDAIRETLIVPVRTP